VAYMLVGILLGPFGLKLIPNVNIIHGVSNVGIIFLLFLLGLNLPIRKLGLMLQKAVGIALISSFIFAAIGYLIAWAFGFGVVGCLVIGAAMMFSSTIIGIKLLPTTVLHHLHTGEVMISILLLQDLIAIVVLLLMHAVSSSGALWRNVLWVLLGLPVILIFAYLFNRYVLTPLFSRFQRIKEYLFLLAIGWCMAMAQLATVLGLSTEIGAFIAGVGLAASPVSLYIAESLKPVRDFFLVLFFFSVGATFNLHYLPLVIIPALLLVISLSLIKPVTYCGLLKWFGETTQVGWEVGVRLAQISEFSLIIAYEGLANHLISNEAAYLIEAVTILSFIVSSYWVVLKYPTPVAISDQLRRD
jgi:Kef-type K+ transport system membrane component KefB